MGLHICSIDAVGPLPRKISYAAFKARVLKAGRFSIFEAMEDNRAARFYTRLARDSEVESKPAEYPWTNVRRLCEKALPHQ